MFDEQDYDQYGKLTDEAHKELEREVFGYLAYDGAYLCRGCLMFLDDKDEQARAEPVYEYGTICFTCGKVC